MKRIFQMCLNWRVLAALAVVGAGVWIVAPNLLAGIVPLLLVAVCPISMLLMMRGMQGTRPESTKAPGVDHDGRERLAHLKRELSSIQAQEEAISRDIRRLEHNGPGEDRADGATASRAETSLEARP
ncbi:MAG: DUF2933 domain-containing protein [Actinomycetota bacterium]